MVNNNRMPRESSSDNGSFDSVPSRKGAHDVSETEGLYATKNQRGKSVKMRMDSDEDFPSPPYYENEDEVIEADATPEERTARAKMKQSYAYCRLKHGEPSRPRLARDRSEKVMDDFLGPSF